MGQVLIADPSGRTFEADTLHCAHCQGIMFVKATDKSKTDPGRHCTICDAPVHATRKCAACVPFLKSLEAAERSRA